MEDMVEFKTYYKKVGNSLVWVKGEIKDNGLTRTEYSYKQHLNNAKTITTIYDVKPESMSDE
jgi:hypothetical protein